MTLNLSHRAGATIFSQTTLNQNFVRSVLKTICPQSWHHPIRVENTLTLVTNFTRARERLLETTLELDFPEVLVANQFGRHGRNQDQNCSIGKKWSTPWVDTSRVLKVKIQSSHDCTKPGCVDTSTQGTEQPASFLPQQTQQTTPS